VCLQLRAFAAESSPAIATTLHLQFKCGYTLMHRSTLAHTHSPFKPTPGLPNPVIERKMARSGSWTLLEHVYATYSNNSTLKPQPATHSAGWRRSVSMTKESVWASGNPTASQSYLTYAPSHHAITTFLTLQRNYSSISLQDLITALRRIGAMRVLRVNAKQLQVDPPCGRPAPRAPAQYIRT